MRNLFRADWLNAMWQSNPRRNEGCQWFLLSSSQPHGRVLLCIRPQNVALLPSSVLPTVPRPAAFRLLLRGATLVPTSLRRLSPLPGVPFPLVFSWLKYHSLQEPCPLLQSLLPLRLPLPVQLHGGLHSPCSFMPLIPSLPSEGSSHRGWELACCSLLRFP